MHIQPTVGTATQEPNSLTKAAPTDKSKEAVEASSKLSSSAASTASKTTTSGAGPAATVTISSDARAQLRAAGVSTNEISHINLKDKNAVMRAMQRARMSHGQHAAPAKPESSSREANAAKPNS